MIIFTDKKCFKSFLVYLNGISFCFCS